MVLCVLVDPGGKAHHVADEHALGELAARFGLNESNLRHLAGLFVGNTYLQGVPIGLPCRTCGPGGAIGRHRLCSGFKPGRTR